MENKYVIVLLGPQGSGKGTQGQKLAAKLNLQYLETGQLLRDEIDSGSERGVFYSTIINSGGHLEDKDVSDFMTGKLKEVYSKQGGFLVDGFPRSHGQADALETVAKPTHVLLIDIPDAESIRRLSARWQCPKDGKIYNLITDPPKNAQACDDCQTKLEQRLDDTPSGIKKRLDWYHKDTLPLINRYQKQGVLHQIDGTSDIEEVEKAVWNIFATPPLTPPPAFVKTTAGRQRGGESL